MIKGIVSLAVVCLPCIPLLIVYVHVTCFSVGGIKLIMVLAALCIYVRNVLNSLHVISLQGEDLSMSGPNYCESAIGNKCYCLCDLQHLCYYRKKLKLRKIISVTISKLEKAKMLRSHPSICKSTTQGMTVFLEKNLNLE